MKSLPPSRIPVLARSRRGEAGWATMTGRALAALGLGCLLGLLGLFGQLGLPGLAANAWAQPPAGQDGAAIDGAVRGVVKASEETVLSSRLAARIAEMPYKEGQRFARGKPLVVFECERLQAEARAAWAAQRADETLVRQNTELDRYRAIGRNEVEIARARADQSRAVATGLDAQLRDCRILAPFSGLVVENLARRHEVSAPGKDLLRIINDETLEIHLVVPSTWMRWLAPGEVFDFLVDETGGVHRGRVERTGASVDPVSQTIRIVGQIEGRAAGILPGMSGSARFRQAAGATPGRPGSGD